MKQVLGIFQKREEILKWMYKYNNGVKNNIDKKVKN